LHGDISFFEDEVAMINPIKPNIGLWLSLNMNIALLFTTDTETPL